MGNQLPLILLAFGGGFASFLSPCVLPLVPGYISLMSGVSVDRLKADGSGGNTRRAVILNSLAFNAGLSVIFLTLGTTAGFLGASITNNRWIRIIGGIVIIIFGAQLIGLLKISALYKDTRLFSNDKPHGPLGSFTLGIAFAAGWTPCIGPILGTILGLAATSGGWRSGLMLSAFYSAGLAIPFLFTGLFINWFLAFYAKFRRHLHKVEVVSGVVMISIGLLVATGYSGTLLNSTWLAKRLPDLEGKLLKWRGIAPPPPPTAAAGNNFQPMPDVHFQTLAGQPFTVGQLRGNVVLLNFWATYCIPCREEIPVLNAMQHELEPRGLKIVGASLEDTVANIESYQKDVIKFDYQVLVGADDAKSTFGGTSLPTTYLIDRDGRVRQKIIGARDRAGWEAAVKPLLDEPPTSSQLPKTTQKIDQPIPAPQPPADSNNLQEASMEQLMSAPPDILREDKCDIAENVSFTPETGGRAPLRVTFDASAARAPCGKIRRWSWDFGDGTAGSGKKVTHTYNKTGNYIARVNIHDSKGYTNLVEIEYVINVTSAGL